MKPFDPLLRSQEIERLVMDGQKRKYYRFRYNANFYDGIVTADAVGCNLLCACCWNYVRNEHPENFGKLYSPSEVAQKLRALGDKHNCKKVRISGSEPFLGEASAQHLVEVFEDLPRGYKIIIETNGIILGAYPELIGLLAGLHIEELRVSLKGWDRALYESITGASALALDYQLDAIHALDVAFPDRVQVAVMMPIFGCDESRYFLGDHFDISRDFEIEKLHKYKGVNERLKERGLLY